MPFKEGRYGRVIECRVSGKEIIDEPAAGEAVSKR